MKRPDTEESNLNQNPIHAIWDGILLLPLYGIIDSKRGQDIMEDILDAIARTQSKIMIMDILGVSSVDSAVANHLIKISKASMLMGAECIFSGISPAVAQTIVSLGIDLGTVKTTSSLKDALNMGLSLLDLSVISTKP